MCENQRHCADRDRCAEHLTGKLDSARRRFLHQRRRLADKLTQTVQPIEPADLEALLASQSDWEIWHLVDFAVSKDSAEDVVEAALLTRTSMLSEERVDGRLSASPLVNEIQHRQRAARRRFLHGTAGAEAFRG